MVQEGSEKEKRLILGEQQSKNCGKKEDDVS